MFFRGCVVSKDRSADESSTSRRGPEKTDLLIAVRISQRCFLMLCNCNRLTVTVQRCLICLQTYYAYCADRFAEKVHLKSRWQQLDQGCPVGPVGPMGAVGSVDVDGWVTDWSAHSYSRYRGING